VLRGEPLAIMDTRDSFAWACASTLMDVTVGSSGSMGKVSYAFSSVLKSCTESRSPSAARVTLKTRRVTWLVLSFSGDLVTGKIYGCLNRPVLRNSRDNFPAPSS